MCACTVYLLYLYISYNTYTKHLMIYSLLDLEWYEENIIILLMQG